MVNIRELTVEELKKILTQESRKFICESYQISRRTLNRILKDKDLTGFGLNRLDCQVVKEIRYFYQLNKFTQKELADKYNVSQSLISKIVNNEIHCNNTNFVISGEAEVKLGYKHANY